MRQVGQVGHEDLGTHIGERRGRTRPQERHGVRESAWGGAVPEGSGLHREHPNIISRQGEQAKPTVTHVTPSQGHNHGEKETRKHSSTHHLTRFNDTDTKN